jgi:RNA polymerase sigma-70 factor (ECF subfamily)
VDELYRAHATVVFRFLVGLTRDRDRAEDLMQDTFVRATRAIGGYRGGSARGRLLANARTALLVDLRRRIEEPTDEVPDPGGTDPDAIERLTVRAALERLSEPHRTALVLRDDLGLPYQDVAEAMDRSLAATKVLIHRARRAFREAYTQEGGHVR